MFVSVLSSNLRRNFNERFPESIKNVTTICYLSDITIRRTKIFNNSEVDSRRFPVEILVTSTGGTEFLVPLCLSTSDYWPLFYSYSK